MKSRHHDNYLVIWVFHGLCKSLLFVPEPETELVPGPEPGFAFADLDGSEDGDFDAEEED